jgi:hypothetical protein
LYPIRVLTPEWLDQPRLSLIRTILENLPEFDVSIQAINQTTNAILPIEATFEIKCRMLNVNAIPLTCATKDLFVLLVVDPDENVIFYQEIKLEINFLIISMFIQIDSQN